MNIIGTFLDGDADSKILLFHQISPYGIRGQIKARGVFPNTSISLNIKTLSDNSGTKYGAEISINGRDQFVIQLKGINDRNQAETLIGQQLYADASELYSNLDLSDIGSYSFFIMDFAVISQENQELGKVVAIHNFGAGDVLELSCSTKNSSFFYPFQKEFIMEINFSKKHIVVDENYKHFV